MSQEHEQDATALVEQAFGAGVLSRQAGAAEQTAERHLKTPAELAKLRDAIAELVARKVAEAKAPPA